MTERFDVVVVGGRCAGATLGRLLAMKGLRVCVIDRSRFPSEVPSTHVVQPNGVAALDRMGLLERITAAGAPTIEQVRIFLGDLRVDYGADFPMLEQTGAPLVSARRITLDKLLLDAAAESGADVRTETAVTGLIEDDGRVRGVRTATRDIESSLVVGADGPNSTVARLVGAREYAATAPGRLFLWGYFAGAVDDANRLRLGKIDDIAMLAAPTDGNLYIVAIVPSIADKDRQLADTSASLTEGISKFEELKVVLEMAERVGPVRVMARWHGFFREATGAGWVLVGDAGHFKDPTPGQGIADAFRQVEKLAPAIGGGLADGHLDERLASWARWRNDDAWEMYWFAADLGAEGPTSPLVSQMIRNVFSAPSGKLQFLEMMNHDLLPSKLFTRRRALRSLAQLAREQPRSAGSLGAEMAGIAATDIRRRRLRRKSLPRQTATL
ncbi:MAG TPA: NAD(P)/FAD-dependent oxidoreductase [Acidimicrobiales bacterium]|nr:NAD(P)/FAD-dependent oxidoreductase [Acidimicrobiales bacterium]